MTDKPQREEIEFSVAAYMQRLHQVAQAMDLAATEKGVALVQQAWEEGRKILTCGNGGSASTASHYITDWNKAPFLATNKRFQGICLCDNIGLLTAYGNDISYDDIFAEQLKNLMDPGDLVIVVSGSGNSPNVVKAVEYANERGGVTLAICGYDGGKIKKMAHHNVWIPSFDMQICEDLHLTFGHLVMKALCGSHIH